MISVILPTFNERENAPQVINNLQNVLPDTHEIVVVDDNSPDRTAERIETIWPADDRINVYVRQDKSGLGSAVVDGFRHATGDTYLCMDADGQHRPFDAPELLAAINDGADIAVGSRHVGGADNMADWPLSRYVLSFGGSLLAWAALPPARQHLQDPMSGFFAVDAKVVDPSIESLSPKGYKVLLDIIARCPIRRIAEVPVSFNEREDGDSNLSLTEHMAYIAHITELAYVYRTTPTVQQLPNTEVAD